MVKQMREAGHSLVELMVSMAIAGLLLAGVAQAFFSNTQTFGVVSEQSLIQENGRIALQLIGAQVGQSGHIQELSARDFYGSELRADLFNDREVTEAGVAGLNFVNGAVVGGIDDLNVAAAREQSDAFVLRYQRSSGETLFHDCSGRGLDVGFTDEVITVGFYVDANFALNCIDANGDDVELIDGIDDMQVLYGVDGDGQEPVRADKYMKAADMSDDDWRRVVTLSVALLARPGAMAMTPPRTDVTRSYNLNGEVRTPDDTIARSVYSQTFHIRNRVF